MSESHRTLVPWVLLLLAVPVALAVLGASAPAACDELPRAFDEGGTTSYGSGPEGFIVDTCSWTAANGTEEAVTVVNWSGLTVALALCVGAWFLGAAVAGRVRRRVGAGVVALSAAAVVLGTLSFFA
jgi:hypothetical protein